MRAIIAHELGPPESLVIEDIDPLTADRMVKLRMLFSGWDPKSTGQVPRDLIYLMAQACQAAGADLDPSQINSKVPDMLSREAFFDACLTMQMKECDDTRFNAIVDPLLEQRY